MDEVTVEFRRNGETVFHVDDDTVHWRTVAVKHVQRFSNQHDAIADKIRKATDDLRAGEYATDRDEAAAVFEFRNNIQVMIADWVRAVDEALRYPDSTPLPEDVGDWPAWLPTLYFSAEVLKHWLANPFASPAKPPEPTATG